MTSFILLLMNFTKTQKSRYLEKRNIIFSSNKKSLITHQGPLHGSKSLAEITFQ